MALTSAADATPIPTSSSGDKPSTFTIINGTWTSYSLSTISVTPTGTPETSTRSDEFGNPPFSITESFADGANVSMSGTGGYGAGSSTTLAGGMNTTINPGGPVANYTGTGKPVPFDGGASRHTSASSLTLALVLSFAALL